MRGVGGVALRFGGVAFALGALTGVAGAQMLPDTGAAAARTAQWRFESFRKSRIPILPYSPGDCEVRVGRLCYWDSNEDGPLPDEPDEVGRERAALIARLAASDSASPNEWVTGQLVRYLVEAHRAGEAVSAAQGCARTAAPGGAWWCDALRGFALHAAGDDAGAAAAYDSALAAMPDSTRCRWTDVTVWLDGSAADRFKAMPCGPERERAARQVWWLSRPLIAARPGDDARAEFLARRTLGALYQSAKSPPYATSWGPDVEELGLRYGWPVAWTREVPPTMNAGGDHIVGHEPRPAHNFVPAERAVDDPTHATDDDWALRSRDAHSRYATVYADSFFTLGHQLARFRRGDSAVFVAAYDVDGDAAWARGSLRAAFTLAAGPDSVVALAVRDDAPSHGALVLHAPAKGALAGVELYSAEGRRAARSRYGVAPLAHDAVLSDIMLVRADGYADAAIADLADVVPRALGRDVVDEGASVGLFWETYLATPAAVADSASSDEGGNVPDSTTTTALSVSLTIVPIDIGFAKRLAIALRLAERPSPMTLKWDDSGRAHGPAGHVLVLHTDGIPPGKYRLELAVSGAGLGEPAVAKREIEVSERR